MTTALTIEEYKAVNRPIEKASGLPNACYTNSRWSEMELKTIFFTSWTCIGYSLEIPDSSVTPVKIFGLPLLIAADKSGTLRVFHNVCRHRGHRLVSNPASPLETIRCPYHSWTYNLDGTLKATPNIGGYGVHQCDGIVSENLGLFEIRTALWLGMIFVNLDGKATPFEKHISKLETRWLKFTGPDGLASLQPLNENGHIKLKVKSNWKLIVENYCESYHLPWIHPHLNIHSQAKDHYNIIEEDWGAGQGTYNFSRVNRTNGVLSEFADWPNNKQNVAEYIALFPNLLLGLHVNHLFSVILTPLRHNRTIEQFQLYSIGAVSCKKSSATAWKAIFEMWKTVLEEDLGPVENMQYGRRSNAFDGGRFSPVLDTATHKFHRWVANHYPIGL